MTNSVMDGTAKPDVPIRAVAETTLELEPKAGSLRKQRRDERARFERLARRVSTLLASPPSTASQRWRQMSGSASRREILK